MRRLTLLGLLAACASPGLPPGAPPDSSAPRVLKVTPDSGAVNARVGGVQFLFSEVVSERPQGAPDLAGMFLISPYDGEPRVSWKRTRVEVAPRRGLRANTTYVVRLLPGIADLRGNDDSLGRTIVFSTGDRIATGSMRGIVFDWVGERPAARAFVSATALSDSTAYVAVADSIGNYLIRAIPPGRYIIRSIVDENRNRLLDPRELFDTATVTLADSITRDLLAIVRDTLGPSIAAVNRPDSVTLRIQFDRGLDSTQRLTLANFTLKAQDSSVVPFQALVMGRAFDKQREDSIRLKAIQDSVNQARQQDSLRRADSVRAAAAGRPLGRRPGAPPPGVQAVRPAGDSARRPPPKPSVPPPETEVVLRLTQPLRPMTAYRLRAGNIRSFLGYNRTSERQFQMPRAAPPDTTRRDTTARRDTVGTR
jgi:hypothetical protein